MAIRRMQALRHGTGEGQKTRTTKTSMRTMTVASANMGAVPLSSGTGPEALSPASGPIFHRSPLLQQVDRTGQRRGTGETLYLPSSPNPDERAKGPRGGRS